MTYEVGKWYRVPCVFGTVHEHSRWWPVIGPKHEDAALIGFPYQHFHIDWRFVPERFVRSSQCGRGPGFEFAITLQEGKPDYPGKVVINPRGLGQPEPRRAKYFREFNSPPFHRMTWLDKLTAAHEKCTLKPGMICPHRGIPLATVPAVNGIVTCPGHGLRWNVATGELVT